METLAYCFGDSAGTSAGTPLGSKGRWRFGEMVCALAGSCSREPGSVAQRWELWVASELLVQGTPPL